MTWHVLSLYDRSGRMVAPWVAAGHRATIADIAPTRCEDPRVQTLQVDLRHETPPGKFDVVFGFPPCTDLAGSGARWWAAKATADPGFQEHAAHLFDRVFQIAQDCGARFAIAENPSGALSTLRRPPDYTFDPCDFAGYPGGSADRYTKRTCLWAWGAFTMPQPVRLAPVGKNPIHYAAPGPERAYFRSLTPRGFAAAVYAANAPENPPVPVPTQQQLEFQP